MNKKYYHLQITLIISAASSAASNRKFIVHLLEDRKSDMMNHREILGRMIFPDA